MRLVANKFSALELCDQGEYLGAAEALGLSVGQWPRSEGNSDYAEALLAAGIITSSVGGIQQSGDQAVAREMLEESFRLSGDWTARAWQAWTFYWQDDLEQALNLVEESLTHDLSDAARFRSGYLLAAIYWQQGKLDDAWAAIERAVPLYETSSPILKGKLHCQRAMILRSQGETDRAILELEFAIHFYEGHPRCEAVAQNNLAGIYLETKQYDRAHEYADTARKLFHQLGDKTYEAKSLDQSALIYLAEGNIQKAREANAHSLVLVDRGEIVNECLATSAKIKHQAIFYEKTDNVKMSDTSPTSKPATNLGNVMEPLEMATFLLQNQPDNAVVLLNLLIWARSNHSDPQHEAVLDEVEEAVYAKTPDCLSHLEEYRRSRLPTSGS